MTETVTPINTSTDSPGDPIAVGTWPDAMAITPDGSTAYVANNLDNTVTPIDVATDTAGSPFGGSEPIAIAITPDGSTAYVTDYGDGTVTPIDVATDTAGSPITVGNAPAAMAITPDGPPPTRPTRATTPSSRSPCPPPGHRNRGGRISTRHRHHPRRSIAYVANQGGGTVTPIDIATNTAGSPIAVGSAPIAIAISYVTAGPATHLAVTAPATATAGTPFDFSRHRPRRQRQHRHRIHRHRELRQLRRRGHPAGRLHLRGR